MNYTTIEKQLIAQADKQLEAEIRKTCEPFMQLVQYSNKPLESIVRWQGQDHKVSLKYRGLLFKVMQDVLLDELQTKRREAALTGFMSKFNQVVQQIKNLGIELEGISDNQSEE